MKLRGFWIIIAIWVLVIVSMWLLCGCAANRILSDIGQQVGKSDVKSYAEKGQPAAADIKKSWPYVSGLIKGVMGPSWTTDLSGYAFDAAETLDKLCAKESLTQIEEGQLVGARLRFGWYYDKHLADQYGLPLLKQLENYFGFALPF